MLAGDGDTLPVSAFPPDGTFPVATARWEKRSIAQELPVWDPSLCIQCNKCVLVCPHSAIRAGVCPVADTQSAPESFLHTKLRSNDLPGYEYVIQVAPS
jgi:pyruvate-ferredoxin/flavodoxin oxidoreductase